MVMVMVMCMLMVMMMVGDVDDDDVDDDDDDATEARQPAQPCSRDRVQSAGCRNMAGIVLQSC